MSQDYYDRYGPLLEGTGNGYKPLLDQLRKEFGLNFLVENMGGGCEAIRADMEGGWEIRITDSIEFIDGHMADRLIFEAQHHPRGWYVGIYKIDADWPAAAVLDPDARANELVPILHTALAKLLASGGGDEDRIGAINNTWTCCPH